MQKAFGRRKFIGMSAMASAAVMGSSVIGLNSCKKDIAEPTLYGEDTDALVIGSGFGGAVSALRLAEAGVQTTMLEMGKHYEVTGTQQPFTSTLDPDGRSTWLRNQSILPFGPKLSWYDKQLGVLDRVDYENMKIYRGTCLGGGSVVYGCMLPQANEILWPDEFPDISYAEMDSKWYPKVRSVIPTNVVPDDLLNSEYYKFARVGLDHTDKAGMERFFIPAGVDWEKMREEMKPGAKKYLLNGDLLYGVNSGAKHSVDRNYIPAAVGTGNLKIYTMSKVSFIKKLIDNRYEVMVEKIDDRGIVVKRETIRAKYVYVCAGTVGTNQILLRSIKEGGLPNLEFIGEGVGTNGNIMTVRNQLKEDVGAKQGIVPVTGYYQPDNPYGVLLAEQAPLPLGFEMRLLNMLAVTVNEYRGKFVIDDSNDEKVSLKWDVNGLEQGHAAARHFVEKLISTSGGSTATNFFPKDGFSNDFTYHPLGGVVRGKSSDAYGRLKGYKGLYAIDGSMIHGSTCAANPSLTIAAIAERCMDTIVKNDLG